MSRLSNDQRDASGNLINGYDYDHQAWVKDGLYVRCGHPESMDCGCFGREHAGESVKEANWKFDPNFYSDVLR